MRAKKYKNNEFWPAFSLRMKFMSMYMVKSGNFKETFASLCPGQDMKTWLKSHIYSYDKESGTFYDYSECCTMDFEEWFVQQPLERYGIIPEYHIILFGIFPKYCEYFRELFLNSQRNHI